jgi:anti-anti-sigma factor
MRYSITPIDDLLLIEAEGPCVGESNARALEEDVEDWLGHGYRHVMLDLGRCQFTSSSGIGGIAAVRAKVVNAGGRFFLCNVRSRVRASLAVCGLWKMVDVVQDHHDALAAMRRIA